MNLTVEYDTRDRVRSVAVVTGLSLKDATLAADRLRSWAMIRGVPIAGPAFLRLAGTRACSVQLPIGAEVMPHPETGIALDAAPAGHVARLHGVRFGEIRGVGRELQEALAATVPDNSLEFHSVDGDFLEGDLVLALATAPQHRPKTIAIPGGDEGPLTDQPSAAVRVVTIARQHGTGGEEIAASVAHQLGLRLIDYEVFRRAADEAGVSPEAVKQAGVHRGRFSRILEGMSRGSGGSGELWVTPVPLRMTPLFTSAEYRAFVESALRDLAEQGDVLILGHGAQLVLAGRPDTLRVLITGSLGGRAARAIAKGLAAEEANRVIREADQERVDYFREFYDRGWLDPASYDFVINTDRTSAEDAAGIILDLVKRRSAAGQQ